jgi:PEGA domain-containing protein
MTNARQLEESVHPPPPPARSPSRPPLPRILDDDWEAPPRSRGRGRVVVIAAFTGVALIVSCVALLKSRERTSEPGDKGSWVPERVTGTLSHVDQSEPTGVFEAPPLPLPLPPPQRRPTRRVVARPTPPASYLSINSSPWAQLSVDGRVVGTTPQVKIRVTPGRHHLLLVREGFQTHSAWVDVVAGSTVRITDITLAESTR